MADLGLKGLLQAVMYHIAIMHRCQFPWSHLLGTSSNQKISADFPLWLFVLVNFFVDVNIKRKNYI